MTSKEEPDKNSKHPESKKLIQAHDTLPLILLTVVIMLTGIVTIFFVRETTHWMEGPAIAILVVFMPLTAISYLHFRLPKKKGEFKAIQKLLDNENTAAESFTADIRQDDSSADYLLPIFFVSFFCGLGFYILFANNAVVLFNGMEWVEAGSPLKDKNGVIQLDTQRYRSSVVAISISFLGAYVWSIQYIFRRMMTLDLPPGAYYSVGSRMVYSVFVAVILQHFMSAYVGADSKLLGSQLIAVSFLVGIFPERALGWMKESLGHIFSRKSISAKELPLEMLEGISSYHKARLGELGIDNVQNLAQASLMELILKTPFGPRILVDWMAQAKLCLEFKEDVTSIRGAGVRTILDLLEIDTDEKLVEALARNSTLDLDRIKTICHANRDEKSIARLRKAYDVLNII
jgi:hypothetical protein